MRNSDLARGNGMGQTRTSNAAKPGAIASGASGMVSRRHSGRPYRGEGVKEFRGIIFTPCISGPQYRMYERM